MTLTLIVLIVCFFLATIAAYWFKTLESGLSRDAEVAMIAGLIAGVLIRLTVGHAPLFLAAGIVLTVSALYVRLTGRESEPADGMILGAMTGAAAAIPLAFGADDSLVRFAQCILTGAVTGYGITFGLTHVRDRSRQAGVDAITGVLAIGVAVVPHLAVRNGAPPLYVAVASAALLPVLVIATVFRQWPQIRAELRHEAALGVIDDEDVRRTAHPLLRLGRGRWHDAGAHREFVRIANKIALRKRQQRHRPEDVARLYQLEVIKLRMDLQEMSRIDRMMRAQGAGGRGQEKQGEG